MKTKTVNQYKCDFCGKKGYSSGHMKNHEKHCTKNPNRECRMCALVDNSNNLAELIQILPDPIFGKSDFSEERDPYKLINKEEINNAIKKLKDKASGCPACILSALRQKKITVKATEFDYEKESEEFWSGYNGERREACNYGY